MLNLFPPNFRILGPVAAVDGAEDSLEAINTSELPNGSIAAVTVSGGRLYILDKTSSATAISNVIVAPAQGGSGRWRLMYSRSGERYSRASQLDTALTDFAVVTNTWTAISGAAFSSQVATSALFSLTTASGRLTYNGPSGLTFGFDLEASIGNGADATPLHLAIAISRAGDVTGTNDYPHQQESFTNATLDVPTYLHCQRQLTLTNGDTIDPMVKNITLGDLAVNIQKMVMLARLLP